MKLEDVGIFVNPEEDGITSDISLELMPSNISHVDRSRGQYGRLNCRTTKIGRIENLKGNVEIIDSIDHTGTITPAGFTLPPGTNKAIGYAKDIQNNALIWFNYNSGGAHAIYRYRPEKNGIETILYQNPADVHFLVNLNFNISYVIHSAFVVNDTLYWTDNYNPPRSLNIDNAFKYTSGLPGWTEISEDHLSWIRKPPSIPSASYDTDVSVKTNHVRGKLFQFRLRYEYFDYSKSVASPVSVVVLPIGDDTTQNTLNPDESINNKINITYNTGSELVIKIEILYRVGNTGYWYLYDVVDKEMLGLADNVPLVYGFYNNISAVIQVQDDVNRIYDNVPLLSKSVELADGNMGVFSNNLIGRDNVEVDIGLSCVYSPVSDLDNYEKIVLYNFFYNTTNWYRFDYPPIGDVTVGDVFNFYIRNAPAGLDVKYTQVIVDLSDYPHRYVKDIKDRIDNDFATYGIGTYNYFGSALLLDNVYKGVTFTYVWWFKNGVQSKYKTFKKGFVKKIGIRYADEYGRCGGVNISDDSEIYVPFNSENAIGDDYKVDIGYEIRHYAPSWAKTYQIMYPKMSNYFIKHNIDTLVRDTSLYPDKLMIRFLDTFQSQFLDEYKDVIISPYVWEKGDRIRFVSRPLLKYALTYHAITGAVTIAPGEVRVTTSTAHGYNDGYRITIQGVTGMFALNSDWGIIRIIGDYQFVVGLTTAQIYTGGGSVHDRWYANNPVPTTLGINEYLDFEIEGITEIGGVDYLQIQDFDYELYEIDRYSIVEIYRPVKENVDEGEIYYEVGAIGTISNLMGWYCHNAINPSGTDQTPFNHCIDVLQGSDCYIKFRTTRLFTFPVEEYNYSDVYNSDTVDIGRIGIYDAYAKNERFETMLMHTGKFYELTRVNELHSVELEGNSEFLNKRYGAINRILFKGYTLRCYQDRRTTSVYINKRVIFNADGSEQIVATDRVFSQISESHQEYGCINPESMVVNERYIYFFDAINGVTIRDAANGMIPISEYGMKRYHKELAEYLSAKTVSGGITTTPISNFIPAVYDSYNDEYWFNAQARIRISGEIADRYVAETPVFHEASNRWKTFLFGQNDLSVETLIDYIGTIGMTMVCWENGVPYLMNAGGAKMNNFFGRQYYQKVGVCGNGKAINKMKVYNSLELSTNNNEINKTGTRYNNNINGSSAIMPNYWHSLLGVYIPPTSEYISGMLSSIVPAMFRTKENGLFTYFARDLKTPVDKLDAWKIINGRELRGNCIEITLQNNADYYVYLLSVKINSTLAFSGN